MRYKHIIVVGITLICIVISLLGLMYYFNKDECPMGTFLCQNSSICITQRGWCNGKVDCPEGEDEAITECFDSNENWDHFLKNRKKKPLPHCESTEPLKQCKSIRCYVECSNYSEIPQSFSINTTEIIMPKNFLSHLPANALVRYSELRFLNLKNNSISELKKGVFRFQTKLENLIISKNFIQKLERGHFHGLRSLIRMIADENIIVEADLTDLKNGTLEWLNLARNLLTTDKLIIPYLPELTDLFLDDNHLDYITEKTFAGLPKLKALQLKGNKIQTIAENAFSDLKLLTELNLAYNEIATISAKTFYPLGKIQKLSIGYNPITNMEVSVFDPLKKLRSLGVEDIDLENMKKNVFDSFPDLDFIYFKKFYYCPMYAPKVKKCRPISDGVSSLSHLLGKPLLRAVVWGISCMTCLGNALVLWGRFTARDENRVLSIFIRNLAVSDMLMGIYLFIIALEDNYFRDNYKQEASSWMSSWSCTFVGMLAMTSSEVSVLILVFMSVERFMLIAAPFKTQEALTPQMASSVVIVLWIIGITIAVIPVILWRNSTRFYGINGMCFPLHIDDPFLIGWEYSAVVFLFLNFLGLVTIIYVYIAMFASIWKTRHATPLSVSDSEFALRFFLIVLTDAACWAPIIILKVLALMKYPVPPDLHSWVVVSILPVNSAVNPLLYTFTTPKFRERLNDAWFRKFKFYVARSAQDSQAASTIDNTEIKSSLF